MKPNRIPKDSGAGRRKLKWAVAARLRREAVVTVGWIAKWLEKGSAGLGASPVVPGAPTPEGNITISRTDPFTGNRLTEVTTRTTTNLVTLAVEVRSLTNSTSYDAQNRLIASVDPLGGVSRTVFDLIGRTAATVDKLGRTNSMAYDVAGRLLATTYPDGTFDQTAYDEEGRRLVSTNRQGQVTTYTYDGQGRLIKTTAPDGTFTETLYDVAGRVSATKDEIGNATTSSYNALGQRIASVNAAGVGTQFGYDGTGRQDRTINALGGVTQTVFDGAGRPSQRIYPDGKTTTTEYDVLGRRGREVDQESIATDFAYDALGRLSAVTNAVGTTNQVVTRYAYDEAGNQVAQIDALGRVTRYEYDDLGRRIRRQLPGGQLETVAYDAGGNRTNRVDFANRQTSYTYDEMGRLTARNYSGAGSVTFTYLPGSSLRASMTDGVGTTTYNYDNRNRLGTRTTPQGTLHYGYLVTGHLSALWSDTAQGVDTSYGYDAAGRLATVTAKRADGSHQQFTYGYAGHRLDSVTQPNGVVNTHGYDANDRVTSIAAAVGQNPALAQFTYTRNDAGQRITDTDFIAGNGRQLAYAYDKLRRLVSERLHVNTVGNTNRADYTHDEVGNRTEFRREFDAGTINTDAWSYDANDRLTAETQDANGNTVSGWTAAGLLSNCQYDHENRLVSAVVNGNIITLTYDGDGHRARKTVNGVVTTYLVDDRNPTGYAQVVEEKTTDALTKVYTVGADVLDFRWQNAGQWTTRYYGYDGHGNVRYLTEDAGQVTDSYDYDAYGNLAFPTSISQLQAPNTLLYTGEQYDPDLGLYYLRARYYNPATGRFWTMDSWEGSQSDPLSLHKYLYCHANAVNGIDPSGHEFSIGGSLGALSIGNSVQGMYNGGVSSVGNSIQASLFGIQAGMGANEILTGYIFDETGIGLAIGAFNAVRGLFRDRESQEIAAYMLWQEQLIATILAAMEDNEFGEITVRFEPQCFVAGTPVATEAGLKPIEEIRPGDKVWAWNEATDEVTLRPVVNRFIHRRGEVFEIKVGRDAFKVTGEHPFYVAGKGWTPARDVRNGDQFITSEDCTLEVTAIERQVGDVLVFNFEVSTDHNYYVGEEGILTHNANALRRAMGLKNPLLAAHHIVAITAGGAARAREILRKAGVDINSAVNGVALPRNLTVRVPPGFSRATVHSIVHTAQYYAEVERRLMAALPGTHIKVLQRIGRQLKLGKFPYR